MLPCCCGGDLRRQGYGGSSALLSNHADDSSSATHTIYQAAEQFTRTASMLEVHTSLGRALFNSMLQDRRGYDLRSQSRRSLPDRNLCARVSI